MEIDGYLFLADTVAKLHRYLRVHGWFHHDTDSLTGIRLDQVGLHGSEVRLGFDHGGVMQSLGPGKGFCIEVLMTGDDFPEDGLIVFETSEGRELRINLVDLARDREQRYSGSSCFREFRDEIARRPACKLLDVGGRDRSLVGERKEFAGADLTVLDVIEQEGVHVVGDAHRMSDFFEAESFDFIHSRSVFEHLLMPWKVVLEMNRVLKPGGLVFISTHQTIGLHDRPWDFLRFSGDAWPAFFNAKTGFEIVNTSEEREQFIIPWIWHAGKKGAENSVGYESVSVMARKTGPAELEWPVSTETVIETAYPDVPDGNAG